jgi:hypothetical protein
MRRTLGLLAAIGLVAAISPATVAAAKPITDTTVRTFFRCELPDDDGYRRVFMELFDGVGFADVAIWAPGADPDLELPVIHTLMSTATIEGDRLTAAFELITLDESDPENPVALPAGFASLDAVLTATGDIFDFGTDVIRDGNRFIRTGLVSELLTVDGTFTLELVGQATETVPLDGCGASTVTQTLFATNPNAYVLGGEQLFLECIWTTDGGRVELRALTDDFGNDFSELIVVEGDGFAFGLTQPEFSGSAYAASYELFDPIAGMPAGTAAADATLARSGERVNDKEWVDGVRFSLIGNRLTVDGTLDVTVGGTPQSLQVEDASCEATDLKVRIIERIRG